MDAAITYEAAAEPQCEPDGLPEEQRGGRSPERTGKREIVASGKVIAATR
jgi:hypothetical protein